MALADHYRVLGLRTGASFSDVKLAYRNLARLYHPDVNPSDQRAKEKFIRVTQAYQALMESLPHEVAWRRKTIRRAETTASPLGRGGSSTVSEKSADAETAKRDGQRPAQENHPTAHPSCRAASPSPEPRVRPMHGASATDQQLKLVSFGKLRDLFESSRFPRAVALVEGLATRFPHDAEVRQWHAITYYRWGHDLLNHGNGQKASACLKKALRLDAQNKSLRQAVQHDLQRVEQLQAVPVAQGQ